MKRFIRRAVSWLLISGMVLAEPLQTFAETMPETIEINGQMLEDVPEDGNYVYLGTASVNVSEGDGIFSLPIYRTGDIDKKASVTIHAISLTADYGKDYTLVGKHKSIGFTAATVMQLLTATAASDEADTADHQGSDLTVRQYEATYDTATPTELGGEEKLTLTGMKQTGTYAADRSEVVKGMEEYNRLISKATATEYSDDETDKTTSEAELISTAESDTDGSGDAEDSESDKSPLAVLKEKQTGQPTRETEDSVYSDPDLTDQVLGGIMSDYMAELPYACEQVITFAPGEDTAELKFRVYDNQESDGNRLFSLYIVDSANTEAYKVNSATVTIEDDEEKVLPLISFDRETYDASDNTAVITVKKEGAEKSMATAQLLAYDTSTGEETELGEVAFLPYESQKVIKLNVDHEVTLELTDLKAADSGEITTAHIAGAVRNAAKGGLSVLNVDNGETEATDESDIMLLSDEAGAAAADTDEGISLLSDSEDTSSELTFNITLHGKSYEVHYNKATIVNGKITSAPVKGKIYDNGYTPALEVGEYFFSTPQEYGGMYDYTLRSYGNKPFGCGTLEEYYSAQNSEGVWNNAHGNMKYYNTTMWYKGGVYNLIPTGKSIVAAPLYQVIIPDIASTSSFGGGQDTNFVYKDASGNDVDGRSKKGQFNRTVTDDLALRIIKGNKIKNYDYIYPFAKAVDNDWHTPKSYVEYYGFAAIYKAYNVTINNPAAKTFRSFDTTVDAVPVQTEAASGADQLYDKRAKTVYVNADEEKSNLVFKLKKNTVNGQDDVFCELKGYKITMGSGNKTCTVTYPDDFKEFISSDKRTTTDLMDYSADGKQKELKKLEEIATVPLDNYFIDWLDTVQSENGIDVKNDSSCLSSNGYYQNLSFTPIVDYIDVNVKITAPVLDGGTPITNSGVSFKNSELKEGSELTYHAGDRLDLTAVSSSSRFTVMGYEVSTDGGYSFNTVRNKNEIVLLPGSVKGYIIRPCVQENDNCIEITYSGKSQSKVHVDNVIPQAALADYPELKGRYFLDINSSAKDPYERMRPEPGKCYSIDIVTDDSTAASQDKVTRPTVTEGLSNKTYNTNKHYLIARKNKSDNRYTVGTEETLKSAVTDYSLSGQIVMKAATIRSSALGYRNVPMIGYTAFTAGPQAILKDNKTGAETPYASVVSGIVSKDAKLSLAGIKGAEGDRITIAVDNGINDAQVEEVVLGAAGTRDIGQLAVTYPITAPYFVSVDYEYDNAANSQKVDHRDNTVNCFDDTLTLTAAINPNGRQIDKVVFLVYTSTGINSGVYEAKPKVNDDKSVSNSVFEVKIDKMLERFNNGDRIYAYIVDKEKKQGGDNPDISMQIVYPTMDTGLIMCVENEIVKPKEAALSYDPGKDIDLPIIGRPSLSASSGILSLTKTKNADNTMYIISANMDGYYTPGALSTQDKIDKFNKYYQSAQRVNLGRREAALENMADETDKQAAAKRDASRKLVADLTADIEKGEDAYDRAHPEEQERSDQADGRVAEMTQNGMISVQACVNLSWSFVYDAKQDDFVMSLFALTIGGKVSYTKTFYWVVGYIPIYLNLTGSVQLAATAAWATSGIKDAIKAGDFNNTSGNVKDIMENGFQWNMEGIFIGKLAAGVGVQGCLSVRVYGCISMDIDWVYLPDNGKSEHNYGLLLACAAGVGVDLIVTSGDIDLIKAQVGFGEFENQTSVSFLGGTVEKTDKNALKAASAGGSSGFKAVYDDADGSDSDAQTEDEDDLYMSSAEADLYMSSAEAEDGSKLRFRSVGLGTDDFSDFAGYDEDADDDTMLRSIPTLKERTVLLQPAAEHTRSRLIQIGKNRQLAVFLGASKENPGESAVYYAVRTGTTWSEPEPIADDGTFDTTPDVMKVDDDRVLIVWANARSSVSEASNSDNFTDKYKLFKISGAFYNVLNDKMGDPFDLQDDADSYEGEQNRFFNLYPKLTMQGDTIYCTYLKRDVSRAYDLNDESRLTDLNSLYSTMAYVTCDLNGENISKEQFISISTEYDDEGVAIKDPVITDYGVKSFTLNEFRSPATATQLEGTVRSDVKYLAAIYTIDTDCNVKTDSDRYIYLDIYDTTNKKSYYPIKITSYKESYVDSDNNSHKSNNEVIQSSPQLNLLGGRLYASWIEDGHKFVLADLTESLQTMLGTNGISELYTREGLGDTDQGTATENASAVKSGSIATPTNYTRRTVKAKATPTEYTKAGAAVNAAGKLDLNALGLSSGTISLLKTLRNSIAVDNELDAGNNPRAWRIMSGSAGNAGWRANGIEWHKTKYDEVSGRLKSYYANLYTNEFAKADKDENYSQDEQKKILNAVSTDAFAKDAYSSTIFGAFSDDNIHRYMLDVSDDGSNANIGEYKLAYDGTDVYILYTDSCSTPEHLGTELYGFRFRLPSEEDLSDEDSSDQDSSDYITKSRPEYGFTKPVMITTDYDDDDDYLDEFDVCMDAQRNMYVVANNFKISIEGTGDDIKAVNGAVNDNALVYYYFEPDGSIRVDEDSYEFSESFVKNEKATVSFDIENHGLFDAKGYNISIDIVDSDQETVIKQDVYKEEDDSSLIRAGEKKFISANWTVPDRDLTDCWLRVTVSEGGYGNEVVSYVKIPVSAKLRFDSHNISFDGEKITVSADVSNIGNADFKDLILKLFNYKNAEESELQQQYVGVLKSGESKHVEFSFKPTADSFDSLGHIMLKAAAYSNGTELDSVYPSLTPNRPVLCVINDGIDKLTLNQGDTQQLTLQLMPWSSVADNPSYSSSDPTVAYVDENGVLHALKAGTCTISVYYPQLGIGASLKLTVKGSNTDTDKNISSGSSVRNRGSQSLAGYGSPIRGAIRGEWKLNENGRWTFTANGRRYASEWAYVYNPYATGSQSQYDWFRFGADGYMLTGWYKDTDGRWYYLWEYSDNLLGHMVTGWHYINGKWYYFDTMSGGPLGAMLSSTKTPDGYYVGPDGAWTGQLNTLMLEH